MNYTIANLEDVQGIIEVHLIKSGDKYLVWLHNTETQEDAHETFAELMDAYTIFERLARVIVTGCYSYEDRKQILKGDLIP